MLIGCSKTQGNEPWTQNSQTTPIIRKKLEKEKKSIKEKKKKKLPR